MEVLILVALVLLNGVFAMSEVALLTARNPRLSALAQGGDALAAAALKLKEDPTRFLSTVQIGITSIGLLSGIYGEALLAGPLATWMRTHGLDAKTAAIASTTVVVIAVTYVSIVIGEIVPKRLGQHNAEGIARIVAWPMRALAMISAPFVNLLSVSTDAILGAVLRLFRVPHDDGAGQPLSAAELRTIVLESSNVMPKKHVAILLNLFDLESITVDDVMIPRAQIEAVDIRAEPAELHRQIATAHHRSLAVLDGSPDNLVGVVRTRSVFNIALDERIDETELRTVMREPYFIPSGTPLFTQLQHFQEGHDRFGFVVDEYGELLGLITIEDILEEIAGEFTTQSPLRSTSFTPQADGSYLIEGGALLRELNRKLGYHFPLDGPRTLNGLILEHLQEIPTPDVSLSVAEHRMEIVQTQGRAVKMVRLLPLDPALPATAGDQGKLPLQT